MKRAKFDIVIVNYNTRVHLRACLPGVLAEHPAEIVVVDNASGDGSVEMVRAEYPEVRLLCNKANSGYGAAANQGIRACNAEYVLLLNSDTRVHPGALDALATYLDQNPGVAVAGPRLLNTDGTLQPSSYPQPTPLHVLMEESTLGRWVRHVPILREHYLRTWSHGQSKSVPWVLGAALTIRRCAFEAVGGFDESFFMYWEEVDLCQRLRMSGWKIHFSPVATFTHTGGASTGSRRSEMTRHLFNSAAHFYRRHYSPARLLALQGVVMLIMVMRMGRDLVRSFLNRQSRNSAYLADNSVSGAKPRAERQILADAFTGWQESR